MRILTVLVLLLGVISCAGPDVEASPPQELTAGELLSFLRGRDVFVNQQFGGNGRVCATCHLRRFVGDNFDLTPENAEEIFETDPTNALFRSIDADGGSGSDFTIMRTHALARIPFTLPPNVTVDEPDGPYIHTNSDGTRTVTVLRSTPSIENIALEESLMWDGRFHHSLPDQAVGAVNTHYQAARLPTAGEQADVAFFQSQFFTDPAIRIYAAGGPAPELPSVPSWRHGASWDSVRRGRHFFEDVPVAPDAAVRGGHCATCHSGPMLDTTNAFNPVQPAGVQSVNNNFVSEFDPLGLPALTYRVTLTYLVTWPAGIPGIPIPPGTPLFPPGTVFTVHTSDPGRILTTGDPCEAPASCLINSNPPAGVFGTTSFFRTSSLWGSADSEPFFHNNSAATLEDVLEHYQNTLFTLTAAGTGNPAWLITEQEEADIVAYMRFAFRRTTLL